MGKTAFIDITGHEGSLYVLDGRSGRLLESIPVGVGPDHEIRVDRIPGDIEYCALSLPPGMIGYRLLSLPFTDLDKIREVLPYELEGLVLGEPEDMVMDACLYRGKVLAAFVEKRKLRPMLASLERAGLEPDAVTSLDLGAALKMSASDEALVGELGGLVVEGEKRIHMAMREAGETTVDFRRGEFASQKQAKLARSSMRLTAILIVILCTVFSADMFVKAAGAKRQARAIERSMAQIYTQVFPERAGEPAVGLNYKMRAELNTLRAKESSVRGASSLELLMELQKLKTPAWTLSSALIEDDSAVLKGDANSLSDVQTLKGAMEGFMDEAVITESGESASGGVSFSITAKGEMK